MIFWGIMNILISVAYTLIHCLIEVSFQTLGFHIISKFVNCFLKWSTTLNCQQFVRIPFHIGVRRATLHFCLSWKVPFIPFYRPRAPRYKNPFPHRMLKSSGARAVQVSYSALAVKYSYWEMSKHAVNLSVQTGGILFWTCSVVSVSCHIDLLI